jgi:flagellar protein FlaD
MDIDKALNSFKGALNIKNLSNPFVNLDPKSKKTRKNLIDVDRINRIKKNSLKNKFKTLAGEGGGKKKKKREEKDEDDLDDLFDLETSVEMKAKEENDDFEIDDFEDEDEGFDDDQVGEDEKKRGGDTMEDNDFEDDGFEKEASPKKVGGGGDNTAILDRLDELETKLSKSDVSISMLKKENDEVIDKVKKLDETTIQFLSLYEVVSDQVNPFVGEAGMSSAVTERFDQIEARINNIQGQEGGGALDTITAIVNNLSQKIDQMEGRINEGGLNSSELDLKFNNIFQRLTELGIGEDKVKSEFESFKDVIEELKDLKTQTPISESLVVENAAIPEARQKQAETGFEQLERVENDPVKSLFLIRWVEFLLERVGRNNLLEALNYYVHIGWVTKELRNQALE